MTLTYVVDAAVATRLLERLRSGTYHCVNSARALAELASAARVLGGAAPERRAGERESEGRAPEAYRALQCEIDRRRVSDAVLAGR